MVIDDLGMRNDQDLIPHIYWDKPIMMKIFSIINDRSKRVSEMWKELGRFHDIEKLKGQALDMYGSNFKVSRGSLNDVEFRKKIRFEISSLTFRGTIEEIKQMLAVYFGLKAEDFTIYEDTAKFYILVPQQLDKQEVYNQISKIKGAGVGLGIDDNIYISDFTLDQLKEKDLNRIAEIKLKRPEY